MAKRISQRKDRNSGKRLSGWSGALADAEEKVRKTRQELDEWKSVARVCRERVEQGAPWPGDRVGR